MEEQGDKLMHDGEKSLKKFSLFGGGGDKADAARDKFIQAGTQYKAAGNFAKAANAYKRAADMSAKSKNDMDQACDLEEAGKAAVKAEDVASAKAYYTEAVDIYDKLQKYNNAAKACSTMGELMSGPEALAWLEKASKYYRTQGSKVTASEVVLKMADAKARGGDYEGAFEMYDQMGRDALDDRLSRANARKLFFTALLTRIARLTPQSSFLEEMDQLEEQFQEYQDLDSQFNHNTREHMLIAQLIDAIRSEDLAGYDEAVKEFDSIVPLDDMRQKMLLKGKSALRAHLEDIR